MYKIFHLHKNVKLVLRWINLKFIRKVVFNVLKYLFIFGLENFYGNIFNLI